MKYTHSISSCDEAPTKASSGAYNLICEQRAKSATKSQLERRRVYNFNDALFAFTCAIFLSSVVLPVQSTVYKQTDSAGRVTYTDQPDPFAKPVNMKSGKVDTESPNSAGGEVPRPTGSQTSKPAPPAKSTVAAPLLQKKPPLYSISIISPNEEQTFQNGQDVIVKVAVTPELKMDDNIIVYVDGAPITEPTNDTTIMVPRLDRGSHTIQAKIIQPEGTGAETQIVKIFQQRTSILLPPNRPPGT